MTSVEKANLKMLVLDLDGTVLNDKKEIIPENVKAIQELKKKSPETLICIATGRTYRTSIRFAKKMGADFLITHDGKAIYSKTDEQKYKLEKVFNMSEQECSTTFTKIKKPVKKILCKVKNPLIKLWAKLSVLKYQIKSELTFNEIKKGGKFNKYLEKGKDKISYLSPLATMKEAFTPLGVDKGNAIVHIMEELKKRGIQINNSEVAIVGNDYNDLDMLKLEDCQSYCPANATKGVKDLVNVSPLKSTNNEPWLNELLEDFEIKRKPVYKIQADHGITSKTFLDKFLAKAKSNFPNHTPNTVSARQNINSKSIKKDSSLYI